jgi:hypothetical protein
MYLINWKQIFTNFSFFLTYFSYLRTYLLNYLLTPRSRVLLEKLTDLQPPLKNFAAFYGTWRFITAFTSARHQCLSGSSSIQSMLPHPTYCRPILCCKWTCSLYRFLTFQVPNLMSLFHCIVRPKVSVQFRGFLFEHFVTWHFLRWVVVSTAPNPQVGVPPLAGCPQLLIQYIRSFLSSATWGCPTPWWQKPTKIQYMEVRQHNLFI